MPNSKRFGVTLGAIGGLIGLTYGVVHAGTLNLNLVGTGSVVINQSACGSYVCVVGPCYCFQYTGTVKGTGITFGTVALTEQEDVGTRKWVCSEAFGYGTVTQKNGDAINLDLNLEQCNTASPVSGTVYYANSSGGFNIVGGTGKLATASGGGNATLTSGDVSGCTAFPCTISTTFTLSGGFVK